MAAESPLISPAVAAAVAAASPSPAASPLAAALVTTVVAPNIGPETLAAAGLAPALAPPLPVVSAAGGLPDAAALLPGDMVAAAAAPVALGTGEHFAHAVLVAAVLAPCSYAFGRAARRLRLPQITGYLASGVLCGPYVLGILSADGVSSLSVIEGACLGVIGLAAGAELHLAELARSRRAVVAITLAICLATWAVCYTVLFAANPIAPPPALLAAAAAAAARGAGGVGGGADAAAGAGAAGAAAALAAESTAAALAAVDEMAGSAAGLPLGADAGAAAAGAGAAAAAAGAAAASLAAAAGAGTAVVGADHIREVAARRLGAAVASLGATLMMARSPASAVREGERIGVSLRWLEPLADAPRRRHTISVDLTRLPRLPTPCS